MQAESSLIDMDYVVGPVRPPGDDIHPLTLFSPIPSRQKRILDYVLHSLIKDLAPACNWHSRYDIIPTYLSCITDTQGAIYCTKCQVYYRREDRAWNDPHTDQPVFMRHYFCDNGKNPVVARYIDTDENEDEANQYNTCFKPANQH